MTDRLWFTEGDKDITDGIELRNGSSNGFGYSTHEVWLVKPLHLGFTDERKIADLYCGEPINLAAGFGYRFESEKV